MFLEAKAKEKAEAAAEADAAAEAWLTGLSSSRNLSSRDSFFLSKRRSSVCADLTF